ncbi:hypothetical protein ADK38_13755, partial [Streptomyces varsoviensis]
MRRSAAKEMAPVFVERAQRFVWGVGEGEAGGAGFVQEWGQEEFQADGDVLSGRAAPVPWGVPAQEVRAVARGGTVGRAAVEGKDGGERGQVPGVRYPRGAPAAVGPLPGGE